MTRRANVQMCCDVKHRDAVCIRILWPGFRREPTTPAVPAKRVSTMKRVFAPKGAAARGLALALVLGALSMVAGCAGSGGDWWRERPSSQNYMRLPVR